MAKKAKINDPMKDENGFYKLELKPGFYVTKKGKLTTKAPKIPKDPIIIANELQPTEQETNIGDYVMKTGLIHALNMNVGRHIPNVEDGLKFVERRILYTMYEMGLTAGGRRTKVASIAGKMIEIVHPHGDQAITGTIYRLGRPNDMMIPYVDGHGGYGNLNTKKPSAPRYAEARLSEYAMDCFFSEMDLNTPIYDEKPNYNYEQSEPVFIPTKYPNILMQYNVGIGKGASTTIVAFNTKDVLNATLALMDDPNAEIDIYPDTPVPLDIINKSALKGCFDKTMFKVTMRGRYRVYTDKELTDSGKLVDINCIEFESCPMCTCGANLVEAITKLKFEDEKRSVKKFPELIDVKCSGDNNELRLIVKYERGYDPHVLANKLFTSTPLENTYGANYTVIEHNKPERYTPRQLVLKWIDQRIDQMRRYMYQKALMAAKDKARYDAYCLILMSENIDDVISILKKSKNNAQTIEMLKKRFNLNRYQAGAVIKLPLQSITKMNADELAAKAKAAEAQYKKCRKILSDGKSIRNIIKDDLKEGIKKYSKPRKAKLISLKAGAGDMDQEKILVYNHTTYFCLHSYDELSSITSTIDKSYDIIKITNGSSVLLFSSKGMLKMLDGFAFSYTLDGISMEPMAFPNVVKIMENTASSDDVALITKMGYGKVMAFKECTKSVKSKVIILNPDDELAAVVSVREDGIIGMMDQDKLYYIKRDVVPTFKRSSAGNRLIKGKEDVNISAAFYFDQDIPYIFLYGESGYAKVLDTQYLGFAKRGNNSISFHGKMIYGIVPIDNQEEGKLTLYDAEGKLPITITIGDKIKFSAEGMKPASFARSTTIGAPVKILRKGKYEFYRIR